MENYKVVVKRTDTPQDDELYHWKYTRREKKNGKWVYYYDDKSTGRTYTKEGGDKYGTYTDASGKNKIIVEKSNRLFTGSTSVDFGLSSTEFVKEGKIARAGEVFVSKSKKLMKKTVKTIKGVNIEKGRKRLAKFFGIQ